MSNVINFNPMTTQTGQNSFQTESQGYIQGTFMDDPVARMWLLTGLVSNSATVPMWGGVPIIENIPSLSANSEGTPNATLAVPTAADTVTGFTVFNRAHNMVITPGNNVPVSGPDMNIAYFRTGSNIRIPVKIASSLVTTLEGSSITTQVSWDFTNYELTAYVNGTNTVLPVKVVKLMPNSKIVNYDSGTGAVTWAYGDAALIQL